MALRESGKIVDMKVALVHDDLVQWGGAERVLGALTEIFPDAPIYTLVYDKSNQILREKFSGKKIVTSFLQNTPAWKTFYKPSFFLHPIAFEQFDFSGFDVVISQTTRFAKSIVTKPETIHICYCHTPPRFLWNFSGERTGSYLGFFRKYDKISANRVDRWIAGSKNAQERIKDIYTFDSKVIYPYIDLGRFNGVESFDGGYFLVVSRLNGYKRADIAIKAANKLGFPLKVVGDGPQMSFLQGIAGPTVEFLGKVNEQMLIKLLAGCKALIISAEEDFGLTSIEAQALGKPVLAFEKGGALETVINGETGYFFKEQAVESLIQALDNLEKYGYNFKRCLNQAQKFSKEKFTQEFQNLVSSL